MELQGEADKILLKGESLGNGQTIGFTETGMIAKDADGKYTLTIEGTGNGLHQGQAEAFPPSKAKASGLPGRFSFPEGPASVFPRK